MRPKSSCQRTDRLTLRVFTLEKKAIALAAHQSGLSVSDYLRHCALGRPLHARLSPEELIIYKELIGYRNHFARLSNLIRERKDITEPLAQLITSIDTHLKKFTHGSS